ncbi:MAG: hypothetical protein QM697_06300 [Lachnospiraceae bacterium]
MRLHSQQAGKLSAGEIVLYGILAALLIAVQVGLAFLPNIELVSVLIIVYTLAIGKKVFYPLYTFVLVEGLLYGYGIWWINYLYVWAVLVIVVLFLKEQESPVVWMTVAGLFGLLFGALTAIPYFFIGGVQMAWAYFLNGIPFDLLHGAGNCVTTLILYKPLRNLMKHCMVRLSITSNSKN